MGWPEPVLREVLRPVALEGALLGMPRIEAGPDISGFVMSNTLAQLTTDGWCLSGRKSYAIGAAGLTFALVRACTDESPPRDGFFIVPLATPGVSIDPSRDGLGVQVIGSYDLVFNNVLIPPHHALLVAPASCSEAGSTQIWLAVLLGAIYAGTTEAARDWIARLLNEPAPSNPNILLSTIPRLQSELEEIEARMMMNRRLLASIAHDHDEGVTISAQDASFVKHTVTENAITTIDHALKLCGCRGISRHSQLESYFSDVLRTRSHAQPAMTHTAAGLSATKTARRAKTGARSGT
jgi:alkylation response protein AidB-like acyl-CoA dehydrogenase